eukprot:81198-Prorocentrum_minimum.AAC.1
MAIEVEDSESEEEVESEEEEEPMPDSEPVPEEEEVTSPLKPAQARSSPLIISNANQTHTNKQTNKQTK